MPTFKVTVHTQDEYEVEAEDADSARVMVIGRYRVKGDALVEARRK